MDGMEDSTSTAVRSFFDALRSPLLLACAALGSRRVPQQTSTEVLLTTIAPSCMTSHHPHRPEAQVLEGVVRFNRGAESHRGLCHGGAVSSVLDDVLGHACFCSSVGYASSFLAPPFIPWHHSFWACGTKRGAPPPPPPQLLSFSCSCL